MPIKRCTLPNRQLGWKWGDSGTCYPTRAGAVRQAQAAYASGYKKAQKFNPYHDKLGRFTTADGAGGSAGREDNFGASVEYSAYSTAPQWDSFASLQDKVSRVEEMGLPISERSQLLYEIQGKPRPDESKHALLDVVGSEMSRLVSEHGLFKEGAPPQYAGTLMLSIPERPSAGLHRTNTDHPSISEIYLNELTPELLDKISKQEEKVVQNMGQFFTTSSDAAVNKDKAGLMAGIFRHEFGHSLHYAMTKTPGVGRNFHRKLNNYIRELRKNPKTMHTDQMIAHIASQLGLYSTTSRREMAAELFSKYTSPTYRKGSMDKDLEDLAEDMLKYASKKNDKAVTAPTGYYGDFSKFPVLTPEQVDELLKRLKEEGPFCYDEKLTETEDEEFE